MPDLCSELPMGSYRSGDVLLAPVRMDRTLTGKVRPVVVIGAGENGMLFVCPVSSRPPSDAPAVPLGLDDFAEGGLDLFRESFLLSTIICRISIADVIGMKGRLRPGIVEGILAGQHATDR
ncbi:MAG: type II toxin-antitoxin system PemK/MazF family toxin [Methanomicrobiales archaeon]|nr:type II toxin-antitoxin system PemK/MazF family toxin [Methanomicrobiales archaeon]